MPYSYPIDPSNRERRRSRNVKSHDDVETKALGARIGDVAFDPKAEDGDGDGLVQDSSVYERPAMPTLPQAPTGDQRVTGTQETQAPTSRRRTRRDDIERTQAERRSLTGLRSSVVKPTGHRKGLITKTQHPYKVDGRALGGTSTRLTGRARDLFPHPSEPQYRTLNWLAELSDEEIADVVIATSPLDYAIASAHALHGHLLLGADMSDPKIQRGMKALGQMLPSLMPYMSEESYENALSLTQMNFSREGQFAVDGLIPELEKAINDALADGVNLQDITLLVDAIDEMNNAEVAIASEMAQHVQRNLDMYKQKHISYLMDFSPDAQQQAREALIAALRENPAFAWAVRTFGIPPIHGVSRAYNKRAKEGGLPDPHGKVDDRRDPTAKGASAWYFPGLGMMAINTNEAGWRPGAPPRNPDGPTNGPDTNDPTIPHGVGRDNPDLWDYSPKTDPITGERQEFRPEGIFHNAAGEPQDVLVHEWGHFLYDLISNTPEERILASGLFTKQELDNLRVYLRETFRHNTAGTRRRDRGRLFRKVPIMWADRYIRKETLFDTRELSARLKEIGLAGSDYDVLSYISELAERANIWKLVRSPRGKSSEPGFLFMAGKDGKLLLNTMGLQAFEQALPPGTELPNLLHRPQATWSILEREGLPRVYSLYALTSPQETWAESVLSLFARKRASRELLSPEMEDVLARTMGIPTGPDGRPEKPWERRASGVRSSTSAPERDDAPNMALSPTYPPEVGGLRSRVDIDRRAQTLGVDLRPFRDTSQDADDVEWSSNDWSLSKTSRVEAGDAVIVRQGENGPEVLMIERKSGPFRGALSLPGGMREGDESLDRSAVREATEEVSIAETDAIGTTLLGEVEAKDWDPRFVEGGRIAGIRMDVSSDVQPKAGDDARGFQWVPIEEIANGQHSVAFGHATWLAEAFRGDDSLYERLSVVSQASRVRNHRLIALVDRERAKKGAKQFGKLPSPDQPYRTVDREERLGMRSSTNTGIPYSRVRQNDQMLAGSIEESETQVAGARKRVSQLEEARKRLEENGSWDGADIGVSVTPNRTPANISKEDIDRNGWKEQLLADVDDQIKRARDFADETERLVALDRRTLERRQIADPTYEEFDDIVMDQRVLTRLDDLSRSTLALSRDDREEIFSDDDYDYMVSFGEPIRSATTVNPTGDQQPIATAVWRAADGEGDAGIHVVKRKRVREGEFGSVEPVATLAYPREDSDRARQAWLGWARETVERDKSKGLRSSVFVPNDDTEVEIEEIAESLGIIPDHVEGVLAEMVGEFKSRATGDYNGELDANTARRADESVRIAVASDGMPVVRAEPHPAIRAIVGDVVDGKNDIEIPDAEDTRATADFINANLARYVGDEDSGEIRIGDRVIAKVSRDAEGNMLFSDIDPDYRDVGLVGFEGGDQETEETFYQWLAGMWRDKWGFSKTKLDKDEQRNPTWSRLYRQALRDPSILGALGRSERGRNQRLNMHDIFGHFGAGNSFDRHGEFANALFMCDLADVAVERGVLTREQGERVKRLILSFEAKRVAKGRLDEEIDDENGEHYHTVKRAIEMLAQSPDSRQDQWAGERAFPAFSVDRVIEQLRGKGKEKGTGLRSSTGSPSDETISTAMTYQLRDRLDSGNSNEERLALLTTPKVSRFNAVDEGLRSSTLAPLAKVEKVKKTLSRGALQRDADEKKSVQIGDARLSVDVWKVGDKRVAFGVPTKEASRVSYGTSWRNDAPEDVVDLDFGLGDDVERLPINPYVIAGLDYNSPEGQETARKFAQAVSHLMEDGYAGEAFGGPRQVAPYVSALLYAGSRGDSDAMEEFERLASIGRDKADRLKAQRLKDTGEWLEQSGNKQISDGRLDGVTADQLMLTHETSFEPEYDADGNVILRPNGDWRQQDDTGEYTYGRGTVHFALNHVVSGHMHRTGHGEKPRWIIVSGLKPTMDKNPGSLDNLYVVDTFMSPTPGQPLVMPKQAVRVLKVEPGTSQAEVEKMYQDAIRELGGDGTPTFLGGDTYSQTRGADALAAKIGMELGVTSTVHSDHGTYANEEVIEDTNKSFAPSSSQVSEMSPNALARLTAHGLWKGSELDFVNEDDQPRGLWSSTRSGMGDLPSVRAYDKAFEEEYGSPPTEGDGDCFVAAIDKARELANAYDNVRVVHGVPLGTGGEAEGLRFPHAWVEFTQMFGDFPVEFVADFSNGNEVIIPKQMYYQIGKIDEGFNREYAVDELDELIESNGHAGPW